MGSVASRCLVACVRVHARVFGDDMVVQVVTEPLKQLVLFGVVRHEERGEGIVEVIDSDNRNNKLWQIKFHGDQEDSHQYNQTSLVEKFQVKYNSDGSPTISDALQTKTFWDRVRDAHHDLLLGTKVRVM